MYESLMKKDMIQKYKSGLLIDLKTYSDSIFSKITIVEEIRGNQLSDFIFGYYYLPNSDDKNFFLVKLVGNQFKLGGVDYNLSRFSSI